MARGADTTNKPLLKGAAKALDQFKYEVASELGVDTSKIIDGYWGELSSRDCGAVGGHMVRRMIAAAEQSLIEQVAAGVRAGFRAALAQPGQQQPGYFPPASQQAQQAGTQLVEGRQ